MIDIVSESELQTQWAAIAPYLTINSEQDYDLAVERLNYLLDLVGDDETHPLYGLLDTLGILTHPEQYDIIINHPSVINEIAKENEDLQILQETPVLTTEFIQHLRKSNQGKNPIPNF